MANNSYVLTETEFGIASREGRTIYFNRRLFRHPELLEVILKHEMGHSSGYTIEDLRHDLHNSDLSKVKKEYWLFVFKNPSTWTEFLPINVHKGRIIFNPNIILIYGMALIFIGIGGLLYGA